MVTQTHVSLEAFDTLKSRLISAPYHHILPEVSSDAMFTVATNSSTIGILAVLLKKKQGGGIHQSIFGRVSRIELTVATLTPPMIWRLWPFVKR
jgi:hypothetical protein